MAGSSPAISDALRNLSFPREDDLIMPQPIRVPCHIEISGLDHRPEHARLLGQIVAVSGRLEGSFGWLLALLSRGSASITTPMFQAVVSTDAQHAMLLAVADQALAGAERDAFHDLMEDFRPRYRERNRVVHNIWGHSNDHPDKALWWRASDVSALIAKISAAPTLAIANEIAVRENLALKAMTYTVKDLYDVAFRLNEYRGRVQDFVDELFRTHPTLALAATAATNAQPIGGSPQLDLQQPQIDQKSDQQEAKS